jgi:hypothetical protein
MKDDDGRHAIQGFTRVFLKDANDTKLFDVDHIDGDTLVHQDVTTMTGDISIIPYDTSDSLDGLEYWDASVADAAKPAQITIKDKNGKKLKLDPFDIVSVAAKSFSKRTNVTAVISDTVVEVEDAPLTDGANRELRIAFVDEKDPIGSADSAFLTTFGLGWMRWLFDPYRQLQFGLDPKRNSVQDWFARIGRYAFSSHSWSAAIPGYLLLDDLFHQPDNGHLSQMEQEASQESGNVYSPIGRIRGGFDEKGFGAFHATVGDIARYWYTPLWSKPGDQPIVQGGNFDNPGINVANPFMVVPTVAIPKSPTSALNGGVTSSSATPDAFVPDVFYPKASPPTTPAPGPPAGFIPQRRGLVPMTPTIELSIGAYVAFNQPGTHRVTFIDGIADSVHAREVQDKQTQKIFFDVTVDDLTVAVAGSALAQATPPATITMLVMQRAAVNVSNNIGRTFALTVTQPGVVLSPAASGDSITAAAAVGNESVELSRIYPVSGATYNDAVLATHGVTLPIDIHVPIRSFNVAVVKTFNFIASPSLGATVVTAPTPGTTAFALIPSVVLTAPVVSKVSYPAGVPQPLIDPSPTISVLTPTPDALKTYIDAGKVFQCVFGAGDPPEDVATILFTCTVGTMANNAQVTGTVNYTPAFQLTAASFQVARGATLVLQTTPPTNLNNTALLGDAAGLTIKISGGNAVTIDVAATAATGKRRIQVTSAAAQAQSALRTFEVT